MNIITEYFDAGDAGFSLWRLTSVNQRHFKTNQPASPASLCQKIGDAGDAGKKNCPELDDPDTKYPNMFSVEDRLDEESPDSNKSGDEVGAVYLFMAFTQWISVFMFRRACATD